MPQNILLDLRVDSANCTASDEVDSLVETALQREQTPMTRPSRASKAKAMQKIRDIHNWENCSEQSKLFQQADKLPL